MYYVLSKKTKAGAEIFVNTYFTHNAHTYIGSLNHADIIPTVTCQS